MKKIIVLIAALGVIGGLAWFAMSLSQSHGKSDTELIEFAIKDVETVDRVKITDRFGQEYELIKKGDTWTDKKGGCVTQKKVEWVLDAFRNIEFKGYLPDNSLDQFTKIMSAQHIKVEIFQEGEWTKTWFIGPATQDHYGQVMLLEDSKLGKSGFPVQMHLKNMKGIIEPRFHADPKQWMCTDIFTLELDEIKSVDVKFNDEPERSFKVDKKGNNIDVYQQGKLLSGVNTQAAYKYLHNYQNIHWETANYQLDLKAIDSMKRTVPFCVMTVKETNGNATKLRMYRIANFTDQEAGMAEVLDMDRNNFWCELPNGAMVKCQYFVFNPLILGHVYFPMDISMLKTHDGMLEKEEPAK
jgi:hypothetical protein